MFLLKTDSWYLERVVWLIAGIFILTSITLGLLVHQYWFILTGLVGINLIILSITGFCPMTMILHRFGLKSKIEISAE
ncbi:YgaP family membrane protein [Leptospira sp. GIMC2001]|uniref:YgaP family membrane protein n=1 Tax=Leptospira sp. GIMC2001 TaxID=1513297 RepID=UPI0023492158|nr:DUF2892 domain-containing protein [Leptospira sp. GIMC2001]WCL49762.1 DUF2892 domain-containing protein [Leptospira sp. GIMC2001]